ncbi:TPA: ABC transporter ATP-binding protein [Streptococcus agalactiae]|uniref:ABC transporter ATP-binding protein n=1 Tax=Streptococcus agalactiae TaxID=1311 RepID=A0AAW6XX15_STRAG|nr:MULTISPECIES: ABC transporter ATP-binding protein [Streptococcus]EPT68773.1 ABC transporter [Streptococcus agalactiae CCUG 38383]AYZ24147.1 ABC transporter ATP-binding protein [Streptococcus agalactiae]EAO70304.1 ABC transporter, ATP-binding/permease protein [Streptococcus agalactiae 515]EMA8745088.1 ABC transporter ATP-binding protein [Streptococcus agalactiae]EPT88922.1 ABC transporter [Streptococcus agalactiae BSU188]
MKTKSQKTSFFSNLSPYLKGYKLLFALAIVLATLSSLTTVIGPDRLKEMTDLMVKGLAGNIDLAKIGHIAGQLAVLYVLGALVSYLASFIVTTIIQKFAQGMRNAIADKINKIPLSYFDSHTQGDTLSRVTNDVDLMTQSFNQSLVTMVASTVLLIGSLIMMFKTDWHLATTAIISVFSGFALSSIIMVKSQPLFKKQQMNLANISGYVEEIYSGHNIVTSHNARQQAKSDFQLLNDKLHSSMWKSQFFSGIMMPLMQFIGNFGYVMVCVVGAMLAIKGTITMGTIVAFMTYVRIFTQPIGQIAQGITQLQSASAAMGRVFEFLNETNMQEDKHKVLNLPKFKGYVSFEHVKFGYSDNKTIIHDFTSEAQPGQKVAIVGPTGAGKTTIVNLLMRFYDVNSGSISIDDINIQDMKRSQVHDAFSMVLQDIWLFEGTIKENLIFNQTTISDDEVQEAAKAVGVHHFIMTLPKGYDIVLDDAVTLSVGQKQLLTIARALLKNSPLLILDEATSSVDTRTEELIQKAMDKLMEGRTSFVIAHRLSTIKNADLILVMKDGNIIEQGSHDVLMSQSGFYADLYNSQFESA